MRLTMGMDKMTRDRVSIEFYVRRPAKVRDAFSVQFRFGYVKSYLDVTTSEEFYVRLLKRNVGYGRSGRALHNCRYFIPAFNGGGKFVRCDIVDQSDILEEYSGKQ